MTPPDRDAGRRVCAWCGRTGCPRWDSTARVVAISARRITGRSRPGDDMDAAIKAAFEAGTDPVCNGPIKDDVDG